MSCDLEVAERGNESADQLGLDQFRSSRDVSLQCTKSAAMLALP
jgi:hypothetical protein